MSDYKTYNDHMEIKSVQLNKHYSPVIFASRFAFDMDKTAELILFSWDNFIKHR